MTDKKTVQADWNADADEEGMSRGWAAHWDATALLETRARRPVKEAGDAGPQTPAEDAVE